MLFSLILGLHVFICALVILVILVQSGKGGGFSGLFGGGSSDALFSAPSGSQFIRKLTGILAAAFFLSSLGLTYLGARRGTRSVTRPVLESLPAAPEAPEAAPAAPEPSKP